MSRKKMIAGMTLLISGMGASPESRHRPEDEDHLDQADFPSPSASACRLIVLPVISTPLRICSATLSEEEQRLSIEKNYAMFSRVMTHTEFLEALAGEQVAAGSGRGYNQ